MYLFTWSLVSKNKGKQEEKTYEVLRAEEEWQQGECQGVL